MIKIFFNRNVMHWYVIIFAKSKKRVNLKNNRKVWYQNIDYTKYQPPKYQLIKISKYHT